jgi:hypothetical protein
MLKIASPFNALLRLHIIFTLKNAILGLLRGMALRRTDVSEERSASIIRVTRINELGTLAVTSNRRYYSISSQHALLAT